MQKEAEEKEREKDKRLFEMDLGSVFGDLELPPLTVTSPKPTDMERNIGEALNLPFKPHIAMVAATEIDAGVTSHSPIEYRLKPLRVSRPDYSDIKHLFSPTQLETDPRLRRFAKSGMAKMKDLPLPNFPSPASREAARPLPAVPPQQDPRLKVRTDPRLGGMKERRTSSASDESDGTVYNPQKELSRVRRDDVRIKSDQPYSPSQGYSSPNFHPSPRGVPAEYGDVYNPAKELMGSRPPPGYSVQQPPPGVPPLHHPPPNMRMPPPPSGHWQDDYSPEQGFDARYPPHRHQFAQAPPGAYQGGYPVDIPPPRGGEFYGGGPAPGAEWPGPPPNRGPGGSRRDPRRRD